MWLCALWRIPCLLAASLCTLPLSADISARRVLNPLCGLSRRHAELRERATSQTLSRCLNPHLRTHRDKEGNVPQRVLRP
ncbi:kinesin family member 3A [Sarotherodon galilaeus]